MRSGTRSISIDCGVEGVNGCL